MPIDLLSGMTDEEKAGVFKKIEGCLNDILYAAEGIQQIGRYEKEANRFGTGILILTQGERVQDLRNDLACALEPIFEQFGVEAPGY